MYLIFVLFQHICATITLCLHGCLPLNRAPIKRIYLSRDISKVDRASVVGGVDHIYMANDNNLGGYCFAR